MKALCLSLSILAIGSLLQAAEPTSYQATVSGMVCATCKAHVTSATQKLPGVKTVKIKRGEKEGTQSVIFTSTSSTLNAEDLKAALGAYAKTYKIIDLQQKASN